MSLESQSDPTLQTEKLRHERNRLRLLLEITNSMSSKLDLSHLVHALSTNLLSVITGAISARCCFLRRTNELRATILYNPQSEKK